LDTVFIFEGNSHVAIISGETVLLKTQNSNPGSRLAFLVFFRGRGLGRWVRAVAGVMETSMPRNVLKFSDEGNVKMRSLLTKAAA
jgi:hypothetical protein